jgi:ATP-dependent helicase/nuclease subunit B
LDPLRPEADPRLRGVVLHEIMEGFVRDRAATRDDLLRIADEVLADRVAWPLARAIWRSRFEKAADAFLAFSASTGGDPVLLEKRGAAPLAGLEFTLTGKPDRIDRMEDGRLLVIDYKTGNPPSPDEQKHFDKQLLLAAAMAERGAFPGLDPGEVARVAYVGVKADFKVVENALEAGEVDAVWDKFATLIARYMRPAQGYTARRAMKTVKDPSDYDHLSRFGEWDMTADAMPEDLA